MGKKRQAKESHKQALADQIEDPESHGIRTIPHKKARRKGGDEAEPDGVAPEQSAKILEMAREQQHDEELTAAGVHEGADTGAA